MTKLTHLLSIAILVPLIVIASIAYGLAAMLLSLIEIFHLPKKGVM